MFHLCFAAFTEARTPHFERVKISFRVYSGCTKPIFMVNYTAKMLRFENIKSPENLINKGFSDFLYMAPATGIEPVTNP